MPTKLPSSRLNLVRDDDSPQRVLLADVAVAGRHAITMLLNGLPGVSLAGEVGSRDDVAAALRDTRADVLLIDDRLLRHVRTPSPCPAGLRVIVLGMTDEPAFAARARGLGAEAWVAKDRADDELWELLAA